VSRHFFVYMLCLSNGSYYTGYARDIQERLARHREGRASRLTRSFRPLTLAGCWRLRGGRSEALRVEAFIKRCPRSAKESLLAEPGKLGSWLRRQTGLRLRPQPCRGLTGRALKP
jgi:putative endonuclease